MKRLAALALLIPGLLFGQAQTVTQNIGLYIPGYNSANWQVPLDYNFNLLDKYISAKVSLLPPAASVPGLFLWVGDGTSATDCSAGGGNTAVACKSNGTAWVAIGNGSGTGGGGGGGLPSCSALQLPYYAVTGTAAACLTIGTNLSITAGVLNAAGGGSGSTPMTNPGDMLIMNTVPVPARLPGPTTTDTSFLTSVGTGSFANLPAWTVSPYVNKLNYIYGGGTVPGAVPLFMTYELSGPQLLGINFNMACDNATDDTVNIQNAVSALPLYTTNYGPTVLQLPSATGQPCLVSAPITVNASNIIIRGTRGGTVLKAKDNAWLPRMFDIRGSNVRFQGITVDGNIANYGVGWFLSGWCGVVGGTDSLGVPAGPGSFCPTSGSAPTYDICGAGDTEGGGGPGSCSTIAQGGPDVVASKQSGSIYLYKALAHGQNLALPTTTGSNSNWGYLTTLSSPAATAAPTQSGILFQVYNGSHVHFDDIEMLHGQFGIYVYGNVTGVTDVSLENSWCHDFGVQYQGNNSDLDCLHGQVDNAHTNRNYNFHLDNNNFENIYVPVTGPGNSSVMLLDASNVTVSNNHARQVLNRGGGMIVPGNSLNSQWSVTNNTFAIQANLNGAFADGLEVEESYSTFTGNSIFNTYNCIAQTNLAGGNVGNNTYTGNLCYGVGGGTSSGAVITSSGTGVQDYNTTLSGNVFDNYWNGIWIACQGSGCTNPANIIQTGNVFQNIGTCPNPALASCSNVSDPSDAQNLGWNNYTPILTLDAGGGGTWTTTVPAGQFKIIGKTVYFQGRMEGTFVGNANAQTGTITLPASASTLLTQWVPIQMYGHGVGGGNPVSNAYLYGGSINITFTLNATSGTNFFVFNGSYQSP